MTTAYFYDPNRTYDDNYDNGPFDIDSTDYRSDQSSAYTFLGNPINFPFGIAAGSLPTSRHTSAAFRLGFDVVCYKTQRSDEFPSNPYPNVIGVELEGDLTLERMKQPLVATDKYSDDLSKLTITNSFGVPSRGPVVWAADLKDALDGVGKGQLLIMSVVGTIKPGFGSNEYFDDFADTARQAVAAGAKVIEVNLSCPNVASEGVICYDEEAVYQICKRTKDAIGDVPLIIKAGYYAPDQQDLLEHIMQRVHQLIGAISAINTLPAMIVDRQGEQYLPGKGRLRSGTCGAGIKWAGIDMVKRLATLRVDKGYEYEIIGVGGVMGPTDFAEYRAAGADVVQSVTGAMWNQYLARDIKQAVK